MTLTIFTIHFATINTNCEEFGDNYEKLFTIHFATINTLVAVALAGLIARFTIHFATINTAEATHLRNRGINLQYTLLLLILGCIIK